MLQQLVLIKPGDLVLDYAGFRLNDQNLNQIELKFGRRVKCVVRYIAQNSGFDKLVTEGEIAWLHSRGIALLLVYEWSATRANLGGPAGKIDGLFAAKRCQELKYPVDDRLALIWAIDTNTTPTNTAAHKLYSQNFAIFNEPYHGDGIYGDSDIIAFCVAMKITILNWLVGARSWGHLLFNVHVEQVIAGSTASYDVNNVLQPFYAWLPNDGIEEEMEAFPIGTNSQTTDVPWHANPGENKYTVMANGKLRPLTEGELKMRGFVNSLTLGEPLTNDEITRMGFYEDPQAVGGTVNFPSGGTFNFTE